MKTKVDLNKLFPNASLNRMGGDHLVMSCPWCYKEDHFFLNKYKIFEKDSNGIYKNAFDCKVCSVVGNLPKLLKKLGKSNLLEGETIIFDKKLEKRLSLNKEVVEEIYDFSVASRKLPTGFKRIYQDEYLNSRGFTEREYYKYTIGRTNSSFKYEDYIIISVDQDNECKGHLARSILSKKEIEIINQKFKDEGSKQRYLRYRNSDADFSKLLMGYDEIGYLTKRVILVEGYFDKVRTDQCLGLDNDLEMKCCSTFGKNISKCHIERLKHKKIENVILIQDPDAIKDSKRHAFELKEHFNVLVGFTGKGDLGDSSRDDILRVMDKLKTPEAYFSGKVVKKKFL